MSHLRGPLLHPASDRLTSPPRYSWSTSRSPASQCIQVLTYVKSLKPTCRYRVRLGNREIECNSLDSELEGRLIKWAKTEGPEERELVIEVEP